MSRSQGSIHFQSLKFSNYSVTMVGKNTRLKMIAVYQKTDMHRQCIFLQKKDQNRRGPSSLQGKFCGDPESFSRDPGSPLVICPEVCPNGSYPLDPPAPVMWRRPAIPSCLQSQYHCQALSTRLHTVTRWQNKRFNVSTVQEIFTKVPTANVIDFLKEINLFQSI